MIKNKNIDPDAAIASSKIAGTLTGKTLTAPTITAPVITGAATIADGATLTTPIITLDVQALAALGADQAGAGAVTATSPGFVVVSAADGTKGVRLPAAAAGMKYTIKNNVNAVLKVYPATSDAINALTANDSISMAALTCADFTTADAVTWFTTPLLPS